MANTKISDMTAIAAFLDAMNIPIQDGSVAEALQNKRFTVLQLTQEIFSNRVLALNIANCGIKYVTSASATTHAFDLATIFSDITFTTKSIHCSIEYLGESVGGETESRVIHAVRATGGAWSAFNIGTSAQTGGANFTSASAATTVVTIDTIDDTEVSLIIRIIII